MSNYVKPKDFYFGISVDQSRNSSCPKRPHLKMSRPHLVTADEINCLIFSYLQDSGKRDESVISKLCWQNLHPGFQHSAFVIRVEGRLEQSPHFSKHIPRGELIELLSKALLYVEVEAHWKGDAMTTNCKSGFSLLEPHTCSYPKAKPEHPPPLPAAREKAPEQNTKINKNAGTKRKANTPSTTDGHVVKRAKRTPESTSVVKIVPAAPAPAPAPMPASTVKRGYCRSMGVPSCS